MAPREKLFYRGGGTHTIARFADGAVQHMEETKFVYDCSSHAFTHLSSSRPMRQHPFSRVLGYLGVVLMPLVIGLRGSPLAVPLQ